MKALNCKLGVVFLLLIFGGSTLFAKEVRKTLSKEFSTKSSTVISCETKFSELTVETWDQNRAVFDVTVLVNHDDEAKANKMLELMNVEIAEDGNTIYLETVFDEKFNKTNWGITKKFSFIINIKMPASAGFELENSLGKVILGDMNGSVDIETNLGTLAINSLGKESSLELNNSEVRLGTVTSAEIEMNNGQLDIESVDNLDIQVNLGKCFISKAKNIDAEVNMGDFDITEVAREFSSLDFKIANGKVSVGVNENAGFKFEGHATMGDLKYPKLDNLDVNKQKMSQTVSGSYKNGNSSIDVTATMGQFSLKIK
jgi:hypothetical protein